MSRKVCNTARALALERKRRFSKLSEDDSDNILELQQATSMSEWHAFMTLETRG